MVIWPGLILHTMCFLQMFLQRELRITIMRERRITVSKISLHFLFCRAILILNWKFLLINTRDHKGEPDAGNLSYQYPIWPMQEMVGLWTSCFITSNMSNLILLSSIDKHYHANESAYLIVAPNELIEMLLICVLQR